jgi:hypothetical protein
VPTRYRIVLRRGEDGPDEVCAGEISDEDWRLLTQFRDFAEELRSAEWVRQGLDSRYSIATEPGRGLVATVPKQPSDTALRELLHLLRPFVLQNEATYFPKVSGRLWKYLDHPHLQKLLAHSRAVFSGDEMRRYFKISAHQLDINDERTLSLWLNAFEYHRNPDKREEFLRLHGGPPDELTLTVFRDMLASKAEAVFWLADLITVIDRAPSNSADRDATNR